MSNYSEHLISTAGGDGEPSTSHELTEHQAVCIWEDHVGDSGKAPTNLELLAFANAARGDLLALVRKRQARIEQVEKLADGRLALIEKIITKVGEDK